MQNLYNDVAKLLEKDERFFADKKILKNIVTEAALKLDAALLNLLLNNDQIKEHFFMKTASALVFDQDKFVKFINNKEFLPNSFTSFKNYIGLTSDEEYIKENGKVVLAWPYKDCVLEGGQDKEDVKRNEIFYNEILAPDEIDRLFEEKVLTNSKKIDKNGEHKVDQLTNKDSLIIKGNNLLALHCLKKKYRGQVKLIYIDPPYNTDNDDFHYNDSFNHSTWLTFMKNRLQAAKELLKPDGAIFVQIDYKEIGYLTVLMDEIFGRENKVQLISVKTASPAGFKTVNPGPIDVTEYVLFYTKSKKEFAFKKAYVPVEYDKNYNLYVEKNADINKWEFIPIVEKVLQDNGFKTTKEAKEKFGQLWNEVLPVLVSKFAFANAGNVVSVRDPHKPTEKVKELMEKSKKNGDKVIAQQREDGSVMYIYKGGALSFYSNKIKEIDGKPEVTELLTDFWSHISWAGIANEGGVRLKNGKKPEKLVKQIIELSTEPGDLVLDYHLGSGTTTAVAHKMGRRYIGIEQLDYGDNDSVVRLKEVIGGEQSGISKAVNWKGGGSFVYLELKKWNEEYMKVIQAAKNGKELTGIYKKMQAEAFFRYKVDLSKFDQKDFEKLALDEQKKVLLECLDKNHLYINYSDIDDATYKVSTEDKKINQLFYGN